MTGQFNSFPVFSLLQPRSLAAQLWPDATQSVGLLLYTSFKKHKKGQFPLQTDIERSRLR